MDVYKFSFLRFFEHPNPSNIDDIEIAPISFALPKSEVHDAMAIVHALLAPYPAGTSAAIYRVVATILSHLESS